MRIGIDMGGTKIEGVALEDSGAIAVRKRVPTPRDDYKAIVATVTSLVRDIEQEYGQSGSVGLGIPGSASPVTGIVRNANTVCLIGNNLQGDLESGLGRPIRLANDADCFTLSEASDGAAKDSNNVFGVIIGTGTGGGIVFNKTLVSGPNRITGEWGHNPLPWPRADELPGAACYCGKSGCIETFLSGPGFSRSYQAAGGDNLSAIEIMQRVEKGEKLAAEMMALYEDRMARSLATIINILDPDIIVLGGGMSNVSRLYKTIPRQWDQYIFSPEVATTKLVPATHGDSSGVRGAAWLWPA